MKISILGCGWFGTALLKSLNDHGHTVSGSTTSTGKLDDVRTHLVRLATSENSMFDPDFFYCDLLVIANNVRMNDQEAYLDRINFTIELIKRFKILKVIFIISTSVYGEPNAEVNETTAPQPQTLSARLLLQAEQLFSIAPFSCIILRFAGLIGPGRDPGRFFAGKKNIPNGSAPVNLIHIDDAVGITVQLIEFGTNYEILNAVSPGHPSRMDFYTQAAKQDGLEPPIFIAERLQWKTVSSSYTDYKYKHHLLS